jgi:hypothetical protein
MLNLIAMLGITHYEITGTNIIVGGQHQVVPSLADKFCYGFNNARMSGIMVVPHDETARTYYLIRCD